MDTKTLPIKRDILDKGYVELLEMFGDELTIVNAARVSFGVQKDVLSDKDIKLIEYLYQNQHMCYDKKTEVFTDRGWVKWKRVKTDDALAVINGDVMKYEIPKRLYKYKYNGPMYSIESEYINLLVTPNHNLYVKEDGEKEFSLKQAMTLMNKPYKFQLGAVLANRKEVPFNKEYNLGYILGYIILSGEYISPGLISVYTNNKRRFEMIVRSLNTQRIRVSLNRRFRYYNGPKQPDNQAKINNVFLNTQYDFINNTIPDHVFKESSNMRLGVFYGISDCYAELSNGDSSNILTFSNSILTENFTRLSATINIPVRKLNKFSVKMYLSDGKINKLGYDDKYVNYNGYVYCAEVSTNKLLVRRRGRQVVCGNSPFRHLD